MQRYKTVEIRNGTGFDRGAEWVSAKWADELLAMLERACDAVAANHEGGRVPTADEIWARFGNDARAVIRAAKEG